MANRIKGNHGDGSRDSKAPVTDKVIMFFKAKASYIYAIKTTRVSVAGGLFFKLTPRYQPILQRMFKCNLFMFFSIIVVNFHKQPLNITLVLYSNIKTFGAIIYKLFTNSASRNRP